MWPIAQIELSKNAYAYAVRNTWARERKGRREDDDDVEKAKTNVICFRISNTYKAQYTYTADVVLFVCSALRTVFVFFCLFFRARNWCLCNGSSSTDG